MVQSQGQEHPLEEGMATHYSIPAWRSHGQRGMVVYTLEGHKESDTTEATQHKCNKLCSVVKMVFKTCKSEVNK